MDELENIQSKIYVIRGQRVMFDFDLAEIYDVKTKALNQAVKRNYKRFEGEEFMFLLTKEEWRIFTKQDTLLSEVSSGDPSSSDAYNLRSQIVTSRFSDNWGGNRRPPYAFTEIVNIQQKGELTDTDIATLKEKFAQSVTGTYMTDQMAESTTDQLVQKYIANLRELDSSKSTAVFTITITTTNLKTKKQVCKWDIEWNKGSVSGKKY